MSSSSRFAVAALLSVVSLLSAGPVVAGPAGPVCGDVNLSNSVTAGDALIVLKKSVGQSVSLSCSGAKFTTYGITTQLSESRVVPAESLRGTPTTVAGAGFVSHLGLIATGVADARIRVGLYTDNSGVPENLVAETGPVNVVAGSQEFPVPATYISAGTYWIMILLEGGLNLAGDSTDESAIGFRRSQQTGVDNPLPNPVTDGEGILFPANGVKYSTWVKMIQ